MKRKTKFWTGGCLLAAFGLWTALVQLVDVQAIGPKGSKVGFAALNSFVHETIGVHLALYVVTDWLSPIPLGCILGFAVLGAVQWVRRKAIRQVDRSILALGGFYAIVLAAFLFFEKMVVNYRPVLIIGVLEASYPSSTTMLVLCVMPTAMMQLRERMKPGKLCLSITVVLGAFMAFMVVGRLISGVHWFSYIVG
jgi:undecaprenyl-diphosphatase